MKRKTLLTVGVLLFCVFCASSSEAQGPCSCTPNKRAGYGITRVLRVGVTNMHPNDREAVRHALNLWNGYFGATNQTHLGFEIVDGDGDIDVSIDPGLTDRASSDHFPDGTGEIRVPAQYFNGTRHDFVQHMMAHELGHNLGFMNVAAGSCHDQTIMYESFNLTGPFLLDIMPCDVRGLERDYTPSEPIGGWCAGGGCTPGYSRSGCSEGLLDECGCCLTYSPIVLDLDGNGVRMSSAAQGVNFYLNDVGSRFRIAWPVEDDDAWLWLDRNGNGRVDSGAELFGNTTRVLSGGTAENGYLALAELDSNGNNVIDRGDRDFPQLRLWRDVNRDGLSDETEISTLPPVPIIRETTSRGRLV